MDNELLIPTKELLLSINLTNFFSKLKIAELKRQYPLMSMDKRLKENYIKMVEMSKSIQDDVVSLFQYINTINQDSFVSLNNLTNEAKFLQAKFNDFIHCYERMLDVLYMIYDDTETNEFFNGMYCSIYLGDFSDTFKKFNEKEEIIKELRKERS